MLALMCIVPVTIVLLLWSFSPKVFEGQLEARVSATGLPDQKFYAVDYRARDDFQGGELVVTNLEDNEWTQLNIQVNKYYQIRDNQPIPSGSTRLFKLDSFLTRTGARFSLRYNEIKSVRIYARRPDSNRATFYCEFSKGLPVESPDTKTQQANGSSE